jgi:cytochrome c oxidase subunit III
VINTGVLFASSVALLWAMAGIAKGDQRRLKIGMGLGIVLEIVFFVIKIILSVGIEYGLTDHAYGSIFWSLNHLHTGHVVVAILMASVVYYLVWNGYFTRERRLAIQAVNIYWQFVAVIWIPVFFVLFLVPRWF